MCMILPFGYLLRKLMIQAYYKELFTAARVWGNSSLFLLIALQKTNIK